MPGALWKLLLRHSAASISGQPLDIGVAGQRKDIFLALPLESRTARTVSDVKVAD